MLVYVLFSLSCEKLPPCPCEAYIVRNSPVATPRTADVRAHLPDIRLLSCTYAARIYLSHCLVHKRKNA